MWSTGKIQYNLVISKNKIKSACSHIKEWWWRHAAILPPKKLNFLFSYFEILLNQPAPFLRFLNAFIPPFRLQRYCRNDSLWPMVWILRAPRAPADTQRISINVLSRKSAALELLQTPCCHSPCRDAFISEVVRLFWQDVNGGGNFYFLVKSIALEIQSPTVGHALELRLPS